MTTTTQTRPALRAEGLTRTYGTGETAVHALVDATLELGDASTAHRVSAHLGELQQALEQRGLRTEALQVRQSADVAPDTIAMGRVAGLALGREATAGGGNNSSPSGQQPAPQRERDGRSHPDAQQQDASSSRHRARRDSKEGR